MKSQNKVFKILRGILITFIAVVIVIVTVVLILYHNPLLTAFSVKQIGNEKAYTIDLHGDMYFKDYLKTGISSRQELEGFIYNKASMNLYGKLTNKHNCSAFYAKTPDGDILLCNDIDKTASDQKKIPVLMNLNLGKQALVIGNGGEVVSLSGGLDFKEKILLNTTLYMACNGMNENGLAVVGATASGSFCEDTDKQNLYDSTITTAILSNASNVDEAITFLENYDIVADYPLSHYMIADAKGKVVVIEWVDGKMVVLQQDSNSMIMTNFPLIKKTGFGIDRYNSYKDALSQCNAVLTEAEALKLLAENVVPGDGCWSVVYNLSDQTATVCFRANYKNTYTYSID